MTRSMAVKGLLALLVTIVFVAIVRRLIDPAALIDQIRSSDPWWLALGVCCVVAMTCLRAIRLCVVLKGNLDAGLFMASVVHNASTAVLPMKLGEFALPLLLSRLGHSGISAGLGTLLLLRALDMVVVVVLGSLASAMALRSMGHPSADVGWTLLIASVAACLAVGLSWNRMTSKLHGSRLLDAAPGPLRNIVLAATQVPAVRLARAGLLSFLAWVALIAAFYCLSNAIGHRVDVWQAGAIGAAAALAFAFPVSGVANVGPFQAAWVWMSVVLGMGANQALTASLVAHGIVVIATSLLALLMAPSLLTRMRLARAPRTT